MKGPRVSVQQGVELLKIHQLRSENAAIHEQVQGLRDAVSDVKHEYESIRTQVQKTNKEVKNVKVAISGQQGSSDKLIIDVDSLLQGRDKTQKWIDTVTNDLRLRKDQLDRRTDQVECQMVNVKVALQKLTQGQHRIETEHANTFTDFRADLEHKAEATDLEALQKRVLEDVNKLWINIDQQNTINTVLVRQSTDDRGDQHSTLGHTTRTCFFCLSNHDLG
jgi:predicted  nucleic acid-binding Zn-ribbon protein